MNIQQGTSSASPRRGGRLNSHMLVVVLSGTLVLSVTVNVLLAHRLRRLNVPKPAERILTIGSTLPPIRLKALDGHQEWLSYQNSTQPTVLYVFTPSCSWCARNMDNFKTLLDKERGHYRFIGLSLSGETLPEYVAKNDLKLPVYYGVSSETLKTYKFGTTPQTIVVSPEGRILQDWVGAYAGDQKTQVEAFFRVTLPGLLIEPESGTVTEARQHRLSK
jgi:peroxiredoxin